MGLTIKAAIEEGAREFDMLCGVESYKWLWARRRALARTHRSVSVRTSRAACITAPSAPRAAARTLARRIFPRRSCDFERPPAGAVC